MERATTSSSYPSTLGYVVRSKGQPEQLGVGPRHPGRGAAQALSVQVDPERGEERGRGVLRRDVGELVGQAGANSAAGVWLSQVSQMLTKGQAPLGSRGCGTHRPVRHNDAIVDGSQEGARRRDVDRGDGLLDRDEQVLVGAEDSSHRVPDRSWRTTLDVRRPLGRREPALRAYAGPRRWQSGSGSRSRDARPAADPARRGRLPVRSGPGGAA
jgi:hypothetical protein